MCTWVNSFLVDRSIKIVVNGACSDSMSVNASVPQSCVLSPTLFLLHINNMLQVSGIIVMRMTARVMPFIPAEPTFSRGDVTGSRNILVFSLDRISEWGRLNLVQFNPSKTQVCAFTTKKIAWVVSPHLGNTSINASASIGILGVHISSDVQFRGHLEGKAKLASKKLGVLNRSKRYFNVTHRLQLYKAQVRPHM